MPTVERYLLDKAFSLSYRETREVAWRRLEPLVKAHCKDIQGAAVAFERELDVALDGELTQPQVEELGEFLLGAACDAATLPERLVFAALAGEGCVECPTASDLWAPDAKPAIDSCSRYGNQAGQVVTLRPGDDPTDRTVLRDAFVEARGRLWDALDVGDGRHSNVTDKFTVIHGLGAVSSMRDALDEEEGPPRIKGSLIERWPTPILTHGEWYVVAHGQDQPFAWRVKSSPRIDHPRARVYLRGTFAVGEARNIVRVEESRLVLAEPKNYPGIVTGGRYA
jgi:hypothetical protein